MKCRNCGHEIFQTQWGGWHHGPYNSSMVKVFCYTYIGDQRTAAPEEKRDERNQ